MLPVNKILQENTSMAKRRRFGIDKSLRRNIHVLDVENHDLDSANSRPMSPLDKPDDPPLPCNQIEYLCDSKNTSSISSSIPCSPGVLDCSIMRNIEKWESFVSRDLNTVLNEVSSTVCREFNEIESISDDIFCSKLNQECSEINCDNNALVTSECEKTFREKVEHTFELVNQSICGLESKENQNRSNLFETKDSFLLDIKESSIILKEKDNQPKTCNLKIVESKLHDNKSFYGLPIITKSLFKTYRNIEKFYDWQEECLSLDAIRNRHNLIYALPTSGGKTLVAEVLMLREVLNRKHNALFILPFVAIVQEKIWSLSPFAVQLEFLVEEYAGGKGHIPPKKRRKKNSIYIATIEKGLALVRSLIEFNRLDEIGLIVVDELHLIGEPGRGGTLETLLSTVIFANKAIQIVGMSATIGNLPELARFLKAEVYQQDFRPVQLKEYVKLGDVLHKIVWSSDGMEIVPDRQLAFNYSAAGARLDPDWLGGLVAEVVPKGSCLVFCPTKRNCENVASLLCKLQRREMTTHRCVDREALETALRAEGACGDLTRAVRFGIAYHHAGLSSDERTLLEHAFRSGVISVLCCTSTLAAGVNLPAQRVIIRAPLVGRDFVTLGAYRQMVGRAGRAGVCDIGESIIISSSSDWPRLCSVLGGGLAPARSVLAQHTSLRGLSRSTALDGLVLSAIALKMANTRPLVRELLECTLMATAGSDNSPIDVKQLCDESISSLIKGGAVEVINRDSHKPVVSNGDYVIYNTSELSVSTLGKAAIKGCMELSIAKQLLKDLEVASRSLVLMGSLHLLYLVTPHDYAGIRPDYRHYYSLYCNLDEEGIQTAKILGITEMNAIRMMTGKPITNVPEKVLCRFYLALMLHDLWKQVPFPAVADKYCIPRGTVQSVMSSSASFASCAHRMCEELEQLWSFKALFAELAPRLQHCAAPELSQLMELPAVKKARALQLLRAGYKRIEDLAKANVEDLTSAIMHLSRTAANHLISAARMMLIEKVENLRAEAEDVMEELNA